MNEKMKTELYRLADSWDRLARAGGRYAEIRRRHADELREVIEAAE